ncbi:hypothetical protein QR685DRAFT_511816, partial [Neurospora intermedia]
MDEQGASFLTASTQSRVPIYTGKGDLVDWNKRKLPSKTVRTITWHHRTYMTFLQSPTAPPVSLPPSFTGHLNLHPPLRIPPRLHHPVHYNPHLLLLPFPPSHPTHPVPSPFSARFSHLPLAGNTSPAHSTPSTYHSHPHRAQLPPCPSQQPRGVQAHQYYPADARPQLLEDARHNKMKARIMGAYGGREVEVVEGRVEEAVEESVRFVKERYVSEDEYLRS